MSDRFGHAQGRGFELLHIGMARDRQLSSLHNFGVSGLDILVTSEDPAHLSD
jgi:hypothetical protein